MLRYSEEKSSRKYVKAYQKTRLSGVNDYLNPCLRAYQTGLDPGKVLLARKKFLKKQKDKEKQEEKQENSLNKLDNIKRRMSSLVAMKAQVGGEDSYLDYFICTNTKIHIIIIFFLSDYISDKPTERL